MDAPIYATFDSASDHSASPVTSEVKVELPDVEKVAEKA